LILVDFGSRTSHTYISFTRRLLAPYAVFFLLFCWGVVWGNSFSSLTSSYIRTIVTPLYFIAETLAIKSILKRAQLATASGLMALAIAISAAGLLGVYAMEHPAMASLLVRTFVQDLEFHKYAASTFNMSVRAMSVFYGYDQAAVTYGLAALIVLVLLLTFRRRTLRTAFLVTLIVSLIASMLTSARVGLVAFLGAALPQLFVRERALLRRKVLVVTLLFTTVLFLASIPTYFSNNKTLTRFVDIIHMVTPDDSAPVLERSADFNGMLETQVYDKPYPHGFDIIFGSGDDTQWVSDVAYVTIYIKYGLLGLATVLYTFITWVALGLKSRALRKRLGFPVEHTLAALVLPSMTVLFALSAMKGPLYFLAFKTGDLVAVLLGVTLMEYSMLFPSHRRPAAQ
jgi:hypothetical protein